MEGWIDSILIPLFEDLGGTYQRLPHLLQLFRRLPHCRTHPFQHGLCLYAVVPVPRSCIQAVDGTLQFTFDLGQTIACEDELTPDVYSPFCVNPDFCHQSSYIGNSFSVQRSRQVFCLRRLSCLTLTY